jgi:hypothetical protein
VLKAINHEKVPLKDELLKNLIQEQALQTVLRKPPEERIIVTVKSERLRHALDTAVQNVATVEYLFSGNDDRQHFFSINIYPGLPVDTTNLDLFVKNIKSNMKDILDLAPEDQVEVDLVRIRERELHEMRAAIAEAADKGISRQFRLVSVKLHPDQHGDKYLDEFETLKEAYAILKEAASRTDIMAKMTEVLYKTQVMGEAQQNYLLEQAYTTYLANHEKKTDQQSSNYARYQEQTSGRKANYYLETHMFRQPPRVPLVQRKHGLDVLIILPALHPATTYRELCLAVTLYASEPSGGRLRIHIEGDKLKDAFDKDSSVMISEALPGYGEWSFSWKAALAEPNHPQGSIDTPQSACKELMIEDEAKIMARQRLPGIRLQLKKNTGNLKAALRRLSDVSTSSSVSFEHKYWDLHRLMSKSRTATRDYAASMKSLGYDLKEATNESEDFRELLRCLDDAQMKKLELNAVVERSEKKQNMKELKQRIGSMIEGGTLADWILEVDKEELDVKGGEPNRIFQLLIEGKKANSLLLDAESLQFASMRNDLFSVKQCKTLSERSAEVAARAAEETERLVKEQAMIDKEEKMRQELESRASIMPLRSFVLLHDLKARSELNGLIGMFMGVVVGSADRYQIRIDGQDFALKIDNFSKLDVDFEHQPASPKKSPAHKSRAKCKFDEAGAVPSSHSNKTKATPNIKVGIASTCLEKTAPATQVTHLPSNQTNAKLPNAWIPKTIVAPFIGSKGAHVKQLSQRTGAVFFLDQKHLNKHNNCFPLIVKGDLKQIELALDLIETFLDRFGYALQPPRTKAPGPEMKMKHAVTPSKLPAPSSTTQAATPSKVSKPQPQKRNTPRHPPTQAPQPVLAENKVATATRNGTPAPPPVLIPPSAGVLSPPLVAGMPQERLQSPSVPTASTPPGMDSLLLFLCQQSSCFKCKPAVFYEFIKSQDVFTLQDLKEATEDEGFMPEMLSAGLKGFKKTVFKRAVADAVADSETTLGVQTLDNGLHNLAISSNNKNYQRHDLECPISLELMVKDPVTAADGVTYERHAIESWFLRHKDDPNGIRSPTTNMYLEHLQLIPNHEILTIARKIQSSRGL